MRKSVITSKKNSGTAANSTGTFSGRGSDILQQERERERDKILVCVHLYVCLT